MKTTTIFAIALVIALYGSALSADETVRWQARSGHKVVMFQEELFLTGGLYAFEKSFLFNDIWTSDDGAVWSPIETEQPYTPSRHLHASLVFLDHIWVMGGQGSGFLNDVWRSPTGQTWELVTGEAPWAARRGMASVVHNNRMFILGGEGSDGGYYNDVWVTEDGITWELLTSDAAWDPRREHEAVSLENAIFILGGTAKSGKYDEVWRSADGINWQKIASLPIAVRGHCAEVFKDKIFVFGGVDDEDKLSNEVWSSSDGVIWSVVEENALWAGRTRHDSVVFNKRLWLLGGTTEEGDSSEIWFSKDGKDWKSITDSSQCGCFSSKSDMKSQRYFLGDILLLGISLLLLFRFKR
ncbi:MAG: hypothetical protein KAH38_01405 [Candidatus Hydrogenedentes bacterium]|nr:hypothetical protein [Candidatus Hydrogenedentota bacterium]